MWLGKCGIKSKNKEGGEVRSCLHYMHLQRPEPVMCVERQGLSDSCVNHDTLFSVLSPNQAR